MRDMPLDCNHCTHSRVMPDGSLQCRRYPPTPVMLPGKTVLGAPAIQVNSIWPPVPMDAACGEWSPCSDGKLTIKQTDLVQPS